MAVGFGAAGNRTRDFRLVNVSKKKGTFLVGRNFIIVARKYAGEVATTVTTASKIDRNQLVSWVV